MIRRDRPVDPAALRGALYDGDVFLLPPTAASSRLAGDARTRLAEILEDDDVRAAPGRLGNDALFARIGVLRRELYLEPRWHQAVCEVIAAVGLDPERIAFDPLRLRVVLHRGHDNPLAAPVYHPHRDTWYAHPQALIAWWVPLDDLGEDETFVFHPERFAAPVDNDSETFDYDDWVRDGWELKIGWQRARAGVDARYPRSAPGVDPGASVGFSCRAGENLIFAGAQFHATRPQATGRARFSLDFRIVDLPDHAAGLGAPNRDNRSRGSALRDYVRPARR